MAKQKFTFRCFQDEADYALMHSILMESAKADQVVETTTLDDIRGWCAPSERFDPKQDILFALGDKGTEIGFSRVSWYTGKDSVKLYTQASFLLPEHRKPEVWSEMVKENEGRLREIAAKYPDHQRFLQSWATEIQKEWISVLENEGFQAERHFNNMLHALDYIPDAAPVFHAGDGVAAFLSHQNGISLSMSSNPPPDCFLGLDSSAGVPRSDFSFPRVSLKYLLPVFCDVFNQAFR